MPSGDFFKPLFTIAFAVVTPVMVFSPYRDSYLELHDDHLLLPSLLLPPFRKRMIRYADIVDIKESTDDNAQCSLKLQLRRGKAKISSHYCYDKTMLTIGAPDEYRDIRAMLKDRLPAHVASKL
jgi:hypothetical protein